MSANTLNKLVGIASVGFIACSGMYYLFQRSVSQSLLNGVFCKDAIELVKSHEGAKYLLGEPIEPVRAKFSDYGKSSKFVEIVVLGPKSAGKVFLTIDEAPEKKYELACVQLQIGKDDSKRLEIKSRAASSS